MKPKTHNLLLSVLAALALASCSTPEPSSSSSSQESTQSTSQTQESSLSTSSTELTSSESTQSQSSSESTQSQTSSQSQSQSSSESTQSQTSSQSQSQSASESTSSQSQSQASSQSQTSSQSSQSSTQSTQSQTSQQSSATTQQSTQSSQEKTRIYDRLQTKTMSGVPADFIYGMDASAVPSLEAAGIKYRNEYGEVEDVFKILADHGINSIRVRIWNDPKNAQGQAYGGGNCDLDNAIAIGKRATQYGMKLHVDFHYSDFWADPSKQTAPKAWQSYNLSQKKTAVYEFTKASLQAMLDQNIDVGMVQVGNETNNLFMCGVTGNDAIDLMKEGSKAVREVYPGALVAVHFADPQKNKHPQWAGSLNSRGLDYDVFGTSYYPYWHGTLENLASTLSTVATTYNKKVMVMETSYAWTYENTDILGNTSPKGTDVTPHEISMQGQYDQIYDVIDTIVHNTTNGIGVCYWEGTWLGIKQGDWNAKQAIWEATGCGWANAAAAEYDSHVTQTEGTAVDNQTFFDADGNLLPSIECFNPNPEGASDPDQPVDNSYVISKGGTPLNAADLKDTLGPNNHAVFRVTLAENDVITITKGGSPLHFYHGENVDDGTSFTVQRDGEHTFWVNASDEVWVSEPADPNADWYLAGEGSLWTDEQNDSYTGWGADKIQMVAGSGTDKAQMLNVTFAVGDKFKLTDGGSAWLGYGELLYGTGKGNFAADGTNIKCGTAGSYDIYLNSSDKITIDIHVS